MNSSKWYFVEVESNCVQRRMEILRVSLHTNMKTKTLYIYSTLANCILGSVDAVWLKLVKLTDVIHHYVKSYRNE